VRFNYRTGLVHGILFCACAGGVGYYFLVSICTEKGTESEESEVSKECSSLVITEKPAKRAEIVITMEVTAYCPCKKCCGQYADGTTASGKKATGKIIAAPRKYPFGTKMHVPGWGWGVVEDRGGAIKAAGETLKPGMRVGNYTIPVRTLEHDRIDLLFPTHAEALRWGRRVVQVKVVK